MVQSTCERKGQTHVMRVLALTTNTVKMAATRLRVAQYRRLCQDQGIQLEIRPFLSRELEDALYRPGHSMAKAAGLAKAAANRLADLVDSLSADVIYVLREACLFGPPWMELLLGPLANKPLVFDLDDPIWLPYESPTYGKLAMLAKMPQKAHVLCRIASAVVAGNDYLAAFASRYNDNVTVIPTVVDTDQFVPPPPQDEEQEPFDGTSSLPVVGWVGSHSTTPYLESILPALREAYRMVPFRLRVVGARPLNLGGLDAEQLPWSLDRELEDFQSLDIGLYPMIPSAWTMGKSALKAVLYGAVGISTIATPVGAAAKVVQPEETGLLAGTNQEWSQALVRLLSDSSLRKTMGRQARQRIVDHYSLARWGDRWVSMLVEAKQRAKPHW